MINWAFIESLEGKAVTTGYVPTDADGKPLGVSGVTIASGVDLGQRTVEEWVGLGLREMTLELIRPYCGVKGAAALSLLEARPLVLGEEHVKEIDDRLQTEFTRVVSSRWDGVTWDSLTDRQQTVVMSVAWQYGTPWARTPKFWRAATAGNWETVVAELRDFGDAYPTRRRKEADYLEG